jgi:hypothetical protein
LEYIATMDLVPVTETIPLPHLSNLFLSGFGMACANLVAHIPWPSGVSVFLDFDVTDTSQLFTSIFIPSMQENMGLRVALLPVRNLDIEIGFTSICIKGWRDDRFSETTFQVNLCDAGDDGGEMIRWMESICSHLSASTLRFLLTHVKIPQFPMHLDVTLGKMDAVVTLLLDGWDHRLFDALLGTPGLLPRLQQLKLFRQDFDAVANPDFPSLCINLYIMDLLYERRIRGVGLMELHISNCWHANSFMVKQMEDVVPRVVWDGRSTPHEHIMVWDR